MRLIMRIGHYNDHSAQEMIDFIQSYIPESVLSYTAFILSAEPGEMDLYTCLVF